MTPEVLIVSESVNKPLCSVRLQQHGGNMIVYLPNWPLLTRDVALQLRLVVIGLNEPVPANGPELSFLAINL